MNAGEILWSRNHFNLLAPGAIWGLPSSGLVFRKVNQFQLELFQVMPWSKEMGQGYLHGRDLPASAQDLRRVQQHTFDLVAKNFGAAGIDVIDPRGLLKD